MIIIMFIIRLMEDSISLTMKSNSLRGFPLYGELEFSSIPACSGAAPKGVLSMSMVKESLFNEETRRKEQGITSQSEALVTERRGRSQTRNS